MMKSVDMVLDFSITNQLVCEKTETKLYEGTRQWLEREDSVLVKRFGLAVICFFGFYFMGQVCRILFN